LRTGETLQLGSGSGRGAVEGVRLKYQNQSHFKSFLKCLRKPVVSLAMKEYCPHGIGDASRRVDFSEHGSVSHCSSNTRAHRDVGSVFTSASENCSTLTIVQARPVRAAIRCSCSPVLTRGRITNVLVCHSLASFLYM
jgi:hypothetical protein